MEQNEVVLNIDKELILLRGIPGAGKTTLAELISSANVAADDFRLENGEYQHSVKTNAIAHLRCFERTRNWMIEGVTPIAVHNTFSRLNEMTEYLQAAQKYGYKVHIITVEGHHCTPDIHQVGRSKKQVIADRWQIADPWLMKTFSKR